MQLIRTCDLALNRCFTCSSHFGEGRECFQALRSNLNKVEQHSIDSGSKCALVIAFGLGWGDTGTNTSAIKNLVGIFLYLESSLQNATCINSYNEIANIFAYISVLFLLVIVFLFCECSISSFLHIVFYMI